MAQIILITAADQQTGEAQRAHLLGFRPAQWCQDNLKLEPDPIPLGTRIELTLSQHVFVKVDQEEDSLAPGLYPSDLIPTEVRELLRER
jgi:hypothetical protein